MSETGSRIRRTINAATAWPGAAMIAVVAIALGVRLWGIWWGAPQRTNLHPDERNHLIEHTLLLISNVSAVLDGRASFDRHTLDPVFLNYPGFLMYLTAGVYGVLHAVGLLTGEEWQVFIVGRVIIALFGTATCVMVWSIARELGASAEGAVLAALWMAIMPLHVWESHVAVTDVLMTFWIATTLWASLRLLRTGRRRDYVLAGAALGLAAGSKYTAALAALPIVVAALASRRPFLENLRGLVLSAAVAVLCCFMVTPYSFLRFPDLLQAMAYEYWHVRSQHIGFSVPADGPQYHKYVYQLVAAWPFSLGFAMYASAIAGTVWALARPDRQRLVLLSFAGLFFGVTGSWNFTPLRYYLPLLVVLIVFAGSWQGEWLASSSRWRRRVAMVAILVTFGYTAVFTAQTTARFSDDTRIQAGRWIAQGFKEGTRMAVVGSRPYAGFPPNEEQLDVDYIDDGHLGLLREGMPVDLIQISSLIYARSFRHDIRPQEGVYNRLRRAETFRLVRRFESSFVNKRLYRALDPMFEGYFISPTIELYARRNNPRARDSRYDPGDAR